MIYFIRGEDEDTQIACVETVERAAAARRIVVLRAQGWRETTREIYMAWWAHFDQQRLWELRRAATARRLGKLATRSVGEMY